MDWWEALECPVCRAALTRSAGTLHCARGHAFDLGRQGYVNLLSPDNPGTADTREMVDARVAFFRAGHFGPLVKRVAEIMVAAIAGVEGIIVDVGAGTGEHLAGTLALVPGRIGLALDASKYACRRAATSHPGVGAVVCDGWGRLPLADGVAAGVLSAFAPRNAPEFRRLLAHRGAAVVVAPTGTHLEPLVSELGLVTVDPLKQERIAAQMAPYFEREHEESFESRLGLTGEDVLALVGMGPSSRHVDGAALRASVDALPEPVSVALSVRISVWRVREEAQ